MNTIRLLFNRQWWWVTLLVVVGMLVLARLGIWQLDRLEQRRAANAVLREQLASEPISLNDPGIDIDRLAEMPDRAVVATGEFDFSEQIVLLIQNFQGRAGGHLVAPLQLEGREEAVLVDRGWVPEGQLAPEEWDQFEEPGLVTVEGVIRQTEISRRAAPPAGPQQEWYRLNVEAIGRQLPYPLLPIYVLQAPPPAGNEQLPYREIPEVDLSEGPHLSYAIQWFLFSLMLGGGYLFYVRGRAPQKTQQE